MFTFNFDNFALGFTAGVVYTLILIELADRRRRRRLESSSR